MKPRPTDGGRSPVVLIVSLIAIRRGEERSTDQKQNDLRALIGDATPQTESCGTQVGRRFIRI